MMGSGSGTQSTNNPSSSSNNSSNGKSKNKNKKKGGGGGQQVINLAMIPNHNKKTSSTFLTLQKEAAEEANIWSIGEDESERQKIRDFWTGLSEKQRRGLVKLEKEDVLKKMKEQRKQTCSCTVCGRRRNDGESQLELLYNTYYRELESYSRLKANSQSVKHPHHKSSPFQMPGLTKSDDEDELDDEISEVDDTASFISEEENNDTTGITEFGTSLTVLDGILTVADDFLKNDGRKFLDLMENLAQRKMKSQVSVVQQRSEPNSSSESGDWDDYDEGSASNDYDEEEDHHLTAKQRLEEGRKMFQIFAAKMFEQRVLAAYREKTALDRANKLMEELDAEDKQKKMNDDLRKSKLEKEKERQRAAKYKLDQEKAALEAKKTKEEEMKTRLKEEQRTKALQLAQAKEEARLAEKARLEAKAMEKLERQREKERKRALMEEKVRQESELQARQEVEEFARQKAELIRQKEELIRKAVEDEAKKEAEIQARVKKEVELIAAKEQARRNLEEQARREKEAVARRKAIEQEKIEKSRALAEEQSKKLKKRLVTRNPQMGRNAPSTIEQQPTVLRASPIQSQAVPNIPQHREMTASVRNFFQSSASDQNSYQPVTSKLGISLQPNPTTNTKLPDLTNLWSEIPNENSKSAVSLDSTSQWKSTASSNSSLGLGSMGGPFVTAADRSLDKSLSKLFDDDSAFNVMALQEDIRRVDAIGNGRLGLQGMETPQRSDVNNWSGPQPLTARNIAPPGFQTSTNENQEQQHSNNFLWTSDQSQQPQQQQQHLRYQQRWQQ